jgi:hypothetical protein
MLAYGPFLEGRRISLDANSVCQTQVQAEVLPSVVQGRVTLDNAKVVEGQIEFVHLNPVSSRLMWPPPVIRCDITNGVYITPSLKQGLFFVKVAARVDKDNEEYEITTCSVVNLSSFENERDTMNFVFPDLDFSGQLVDSKGDPADSISVYLIPSEMKQCYAPTLCAASSVTDFEGRFRFSHVSPGVYDLLVTQISYRSKGSLVGTQLKEDIEVSESTTAFEWKLPEALELKLEPAVPRSIQNHLSISAMAVSPVSKLRTTSDHSYVEQLKRFLPPVVFPRDQSLQIFVYDHARSLERALFNTQEITVSSTERTEIGLWRSGSIRVILEGRRADVSGRTVRLCKKSGKVIPRLYDPLYTYDYDLLLATVLPTDDAGITTIYGVKPGEYLILIDGSSSKGYVSVDSGKVAETRIMLSE